MARPQRLKLAVWKFASCDGCQLSLLDCEDELLALAEHVQIAKFLEATRTEIQGPYDLSIVEGSITTAQDARTDFTGTPAQQEADHHRSVRHRGRNPGAAQFQKRPRVCRRGVRPAGVHLHT